MNGFRCRPRRRSSSRWPWRRSRRPSIVGAGVEGDAAARSSGRQRPLPALGGHRGIETACSAATGHHGVDDAAGARIPTSLSSCRAATAGSASTPQRGGSTVHRAPNPHSAGRRDRTRDIGDLVAVRQLAAHTVDPGGVDLRRCGRLRRRRARRRRGRRAAGSSNKRHRCTHRAHALLIPQRTLRKDVQRLVSASR